MIESPALKSSNPPICVYQQRLLQEITRSLALATVLYAQIREAWNSGRCVSPAARRSELNMFIAGVIKRSSGNVLCRWIWRRYASRVKRDWSRGSLKGTDHFSRGGRGNTMVLCMIFFLVFFDNVENRDIIVNTRNIKVKWWIQGLL